MKPANTLIALGALGCLLGVATGAFGAHALEQAVSPDRMGTWEKAVDYLFVHSLGLVLVGILDRFEPRACHRWAGRLMLAGIALFSGSLFALVLSGTTIIWGLLSGTWFGLEKIAQIPFLNSMIIDQIDSFAESNQTFMMFLCFTIGVIHLSIAHGMRALRVII